MTLQDFNIDFIKFKKEVHTFEYDLDHKFFALKEHSLFVDCKVHASCKASKQESNVQLDIGLSGVVNSICERCLKDISIPIDANLTTVYKLTNNREKFGNENYLSLNDQVVSIYDTIYEQIVLSMPSRLICENAIDSGECILNIEDQTETKIDPRWEELKKLKQ